MTLSVILVDDHALVREGLSRLISSEPDLMVVGQGRSVADGYHLLAAPQPCSVLTVDVSLPDGSGLSLARYAREQFPAMGIVVVTMFDDDNTLLEAFDAGTSALVLKSASSDDVLDAIRQAAAHPDYFVAAGLAAALRRRQQTPTPRLTPRETEVLVRLVDGDSVAAVATALFMSESTVKTHIASLYDKLGVRNRAALVMTAVRACLVPHDLHSAHPFSSR